MKKSSLFSIIVLLALIVGCDEPMVYDKIDRNTWFLFEQNDTIIFKSDLNADSFLVGNIFSGFRNTSNGLSEEYLNIEYSPFTNTDSLFELSREIGYTHILWKSSTNGLQYHNPINYKLGKYDFDSTYNVPEFYVGNWDTSIFRHIYYTDKYGVIAYELLSGELFEIDVERFPAHVELP